MSEKDGGPAFPSSSDAAEHLALGMSLRDYFAGQAVGRLIGLALQLEATGNLKKDAVATVAELSYQVADAMLKARSQ